ncbi:hypothetical protein Tco_0497046 [Tanacetum coccineum]
MTSFDCRLKAIKACSACGNLHTSAFCCSKEKLKNKILVPMPESSQQHIKIERICFDCGDLLHGLNCLECDLTRKILEKAVQKFQNTSKSSNDNSNVVNAPREPFVVKQDPSVNSSQKSPLIDQKCCCYEHFNRSSEDFSDSNVDSTSMMKILSLVSMVGVWFISALRLTPETGNLQWMWWDNIFQGKSEPRVHVLNVLPLEDCPDCEDSQFCHSSRVSHPQLHLGIRYPNLID